MKRRMKRHTASKRKNTHRHHTASKRAHTRRRSTRRVTSVGAASTPRASRSQNTAVRTTAAETAYRASRRTRTQRRQKHRGRHVLLIVIAIVFGLVIVVSRGLRSCHADNSTSHPTATPPIAQTAVAPNKLYDNLYNWENLSQDANGYLTYVVDGSVVSRTGIDVSEHQGDIDWERVAANGIDFAIIRIGYRSADRGLIAKDAKAEQNLAGAKAAGLRVGVYFYSQAVNEAEAREEADFVINTLGSTELSYPLVFDFEQGNLDNERVSTMTSEQRTAVAVAFCEEAEARGARALVYGSASALLEIDVEQLAPYGFWYAEYTNIPTSSLSFVLWQYSESGIVDGIDGPVDLDLDLTEVPHEE